MIKKEVRLYVNELEKYWILLFKKIPNYRHNYKWEHYQELKSKEFEAFKKYNFYKNLLEKLEK